MKKRIFSTIIVMVISLMFLGAALMDDENYKAVEECRAEKIAEVESKGYVIDMDEGVYRLGFCKHGWSLRWHDPETDLSDGSCGFALTYIF